MATLMKLTKQQHSIRGVNPAGTVKAFFAYTHPVAKLFPEGQETLYAEVTVKGTFVDFNKLIPKKTFDKAVQKVWGKYIPTTDNQGD